MYISAVGTFVGKPQQMPVAGWVRKGYLDGGRLFICEATQE